MDSIFQICKAVDSEKEGLIRKVQKKERHKNQYSVQLAITKNIEFFKELKYQFSQRIPQSLSINFIVARNFVFPRYTNTNSRLGMLGVHPISDNYRVSRIDRYKQLICLTLEQHLLPIITVDDFFKLINNPHLHDVWTGYFELQKMLDKMPEIANDVFETLSQIKVPFECHINKQTKHGTITTQRVFNQEYLTMQGISLAMLEQYIHETSLMPSSIMCDQQDEDYYEFVRMCTGWQVPDYKVELINYSGQRFFARQNVKILKSDNIIKNHKHQIILWMYEDYPEWINAEIVLQNQTDFAKLVKQCRQLEEEKEERIRNVGPRCGIKLI